MDIIKEESHYDGDWYVTIRTDCGDEASFFVTDEELESIEQLQSD